MINIKLNSQFTMKSNIHCLQLCKQTIAGSDAKIPGEIRDVPIGDFTSLDSFMKQYVQHRLLNATDHNGDDITNFADLITELKTVLDQIKQLFDFGYLAGDSDSKAFKQTDKTEEAAPHLEVKDSDDNQNKNLRKRRK